MHQLETLSARQIATHIADGDITSRAVTDYFINRIDQYNGPLNALVAERFDAARADAEAADKARAANAPLAPLHGLPMTIKDVFEVEGLTCDAGVPQFAGHVSTQDAVVVQRLKAAGAIILGKTNTPLMAGDIQTYNDVHGTTHNPFNPAHTPGGSSGGSTAALAAGMTPLEYGSDIGGSIRTPAHFCGLFGHKPSFGIVPLRGHVPPPHGMQAEAIALAVAGPLATNPGDLQLALALTAGPHGAARQAYHFALQGPRHTKPEGLRFAVWPGDDFCPIDSEIAAAMHKAADNLQAAGATRVEARPDFELAQHHETYMLMLNATIGADLPDTVRQRLQETVAQAGPDDTSNQILQARGICLSHADWLRLNERRHRFAAAWQALFQAVDVILCPVTPTPAMAHDHNPDFHARQIDVNGVARPYMDNFVWAGIATLCGLPSTTVPLGQHSNGLPFGMQAVGPAYEDATPLGVAQILEDLGYRQIRPEGY